MRHAQSNTAKAQKIISTTKSKKTISLIFVALISVIFQPSYASLQTNQQNPQSQSTQNQSIQNPHPKSPTQSSVISQESLKTDAQKNSLQNDFSQLQTQENEASEAKGDEKNTRFSGYIPREYMNLFSNSAHFFPALALGYTLIIKDFIGFRQQALGYIAVVGATYAVKYSLYFASPYAKDTLSFAKRPTSESYEAFPSGHTASAFAAVGFVAKRYGAKLGIAAFVLATAVSESRILLEKHTILQVICGGILGFLLSFFCASPFRRVSTPSILPTYKNKALYSLLVLVLL